MEPVLFYYGLIILASILQFASSRVDNYGGWNNAPNTQYHIQTDEGDERYFKYQTQSGQYRKEKRLQDGTVVGSYGWVDPNGFLRLRDYIADNAGYRILKSRMLFVGDNADVGNAVVAAKNVPATSGELVHPSNSPFNLASPTRAIYVPPMPENKQPYASPTPLTIYVPPLAEPVQSTTPASTYNLGAQYFPSSTPSPLRYYTSNSPAYYSSTPSTTPAPFHYYSSTSSPVEHYFPSSTPNPVHYYPSSTPVVHIHHNSEPKHASPVYVSSTAAPPVDSTTRPIAAYTSSQKPVAVNYVSTPAPDYSNYEAVTRAPTYSAIGYTASTPSPVHRPAPIAGKYASPVNNYITESEKNRAFYQYEDGKGYYNKKRFVDYKPVDQEYDGISTIQNGFRYFLPRQYHEEQSSADGQDRTGSFGYVDPFGIRRVVYYNTSPGRGFVHRKNNRYVGFNSTPYDPRPS